MQNEQIIKILKQWNFWDNDIATGIDRPKYVNEFLRQKDLKEVSVITGVRRSGKSMVLLQMLQHLINSGVPAVNVLYVNFEEPAFDGSLTLEFLLQLYDAYREHFLPQGKVYIVLDEVQLVPRWEKFVRGLYDRDENIKFYVTGSSSKLLSMEFGSKLTGRTFSNVIYPLSFVEWLNFKGLTLDFNAVAIAHSPEMRHYFQEYLKNGGFPQVTLTTTENDKRSLLKEYYSSILERDIIERYQIRTIKKLKSFYLYALTQVGLPVSGYEANKNLQIAQPTANRFLRYAQDVYLFLSIPFFSYSFAKQQKNPAKLYCIDSGIYQSVSFAFSPNTGRAFENVVALSLFRAGAEIFYWRGKKEVDFVVRRGFQVERLINVCWNLNEENRKREIAGLEEAMREFKISVGEIITTGYPEEIKVAAGVIKVKNFFEEKEMIG